MNDPTTVFYTLSTLAQTCAALAAFVGAVGVYRLQALRDRYRAIENEMRALAAMVGLGIDHRVVSLRRITDFVEKVRKTRGEEVEVAELLRTFETWQAVPSSLRRSRCVLILFEAWNLLIIGASLVGFNYIPLLVSAGWAFCALWAVALGTVGVTIGCVYAWTREGEGMPDSPKLTPETGTLGLQGSQADPVVTRVAETWQFFAFVFAAVTTLALALLDEMPDRLAAWRVVAKLVAFVGLAYLTLVNIRVRYWLAALLNRFKEERR